MLAPTLSRGGAHRDRVSDDTGRMVDDNYGSVSVVAALLGGGPPAAEANSCVPGSLTQSQAVANAAVISILVSAPLVETVFAEWSGRATALIADGENPSEHRRRRLGKQAPTNSLTPIRTGAVDASS
jgi:hypothetical protein